MTGRAAGYRLCYETIHHTPSNETAWHGGDGSACMCVHTWGREGAGRGIENEWVPLSPCRLPTMQHYRDQGGALGSGLWGVVLHDVSVFNLHDGLLTHSHREHA